jgi:hypothetical protein
VESTGDQSSGGDWVNTVPFNIPHLTTLTVLTGKRNARLVLPVRWRGRRVRSSPTFPRETCGCDTRPRGYETDLYWLVQTSLVLVSPELR